MDTSVIDQGATSVKHGLAAGGAAWQGLRRRRSAVSGERMLARLFALDQERAAAGR